MCDEKSNQSMFFVGTVVKNSPRALDTNTNIHALTQQNTRGQTVKTNLVLGWDLRSRREVTAAA